MTAKNIVMAAAGASSVAANYIEDVFSTYLYTATGSAQTITNNIDLAGKGGLVWVKSRTNTDVHTLQDTVRGASSVLVSSGTYAALPFTTNLTSFNSDGFSIGTGSGTSTGGNKYASWTFRKQPKFFDCGTYTGNGASSKTISHALGATPGCIMVKNMTTGGTNWFVYHKYMFDSAGTYGAQGYINLNSTGNSNYIGSDLWTPTSTTFQANGTQLGLNNSGETYAYYMFAHNAGGFGLAGTDNVISCGSFTSDANGEATVTLGYEPQWVLYKPSSASGDWEMLDTMRGMSMASRSRLWASLITAESSVSAPVFPTATGFQAKGGFPLAESADYIYIAIRKGPMKVPTDATKVFSVSTGANATSPAYTTNFPVDMYIQKGRTSGTTGYLADRLRGADAYIQTSSTASESTGLGLGLDSNTGILNNNSGNRTDRIAWMFRRAAGFHDVVCFTPTGAAHTETHNLGVAPELIIGKHRDNAVNWYVYSAALGNTQALYFNTIDSPISGSYLWNNTSPTSTTFSVGTSGLNSSAATKAVAFLFATCPGVSKVGSYTGTGAAQTIACGFAAGARFVMIKRTDSTGDWYVWDTARGIVSGNDPYLLFNDVAAEVTGTNWIAPQSSGFGLTSTAPAALNASGGTFIFLAIA